MNRLVPLLLAVSLAPSMVAEARTSPRLDSLKRQWLEKRASYKRYSWQKPSGVRPKLSKPEARVLSRIARMKHVSVLGNRVTGANDAYYEAARTGRKLPRARMVSLELDGNGRPFSRVQRGGFTRITVPFGDKGELAHILQFQPSVVTSKRLKRAGVYPGAKVSLRTIGSGSAARQSIRVMAPGGLQPVGLHEGYTTMPQRMSPTERKLAPAVGAFLKQQAAATGLTTTEVHRAMGRVLSKSTGFPELLAADR